MKIDSQELLHTFRLSKTDSRNLYKTETCFAVVKTDSPNSYTLCGGQNGLSEPLHASYTRCGGENTLSKPLQVSYMFFGDRNTYVLRASSGLLCALRWSKCTFQTLPASSDGQKAFSVTLLALYMLFGNKNAPLQACYTLVSGQYPLSEPLQASYTLCGGLNAHSEPL